MKALKRNFRYLLSGVCMLFTALSLLGAPSNAYTQVSGTLQGQILDPSGAAVPDALITLAEGGRVFNTRSLNNGLYRFGSIPPGNYTITVDAQGFAVYARADILIRQAQSLNISLKIAEQLQELTVTEKANGVSVDPNENAGALVINGSALDGLSDDPAQLQNELQALAGPAAGPNGGQIYIDGFSGGQLPPKSSIREIRVNQNPFSAEFDRIGYGRIEILTKPGSDKFSGHIMSLGIDSALNTANPLVTVQPSYYMYILQGDVAGPLSKHSSFFLSTLYQQQQNQSIVDAINPASVNSTLQQALANPSSQLSLAPRVDLQVGTNNTVSVRDSFTRSIQTGNGVGALNLAQQANNVNNYENDLQVSDTVVVNSHLINETHFQWRRVRNQQIAGFTAPTITVQGAFIDGGSNSGTVKDHQDIFELQNYSTTSLGKHTIRFGTRLRAYRDANESTSGSNGNYIFQSPTQYVAQAPAQYQATVIKNPLARALLFDASLFYQDEWHWKPNLTLSYGLRYEGQNYIHDHADFGPRLAIAWAPGHPGTGSPKTVLRVGYGWFYDRFTVPNFFSSSTGTPYVTEAIHENGVNQQSYVIDTPSFYTPNAPVPPSTLASDSSSRPTIYTIDPHFHAALSMQGGVGIDRQIGKSNTVNVTYLFTRGVHQYLSNTVTAPTFDAARYMVTGPLPSLYNDQFQSGGIFNENQIIVTSTVNYRKLVLRGSYTYSEAESDTQGVNFFPSVAQDPGLDYGRATFGIHHRFFMLATYSAPKGIIIAPLLVAQSGTPYNVTLGSDLTGNNQFNARPTYGTCGTPGVISTAYGCLDSDPTGKGEALVPFDSATGPANVVFHIRASKVIGVGPHIVGANGAQSAQGGGSVNGRGLSGNQAQTKLDASVPRKYSITFIAGALNLFNVVNRGTPNGVLSSPLFGTSQTLAGGSFASPTAGNRTIFFQSLFSF